MSESLRHRGPDSDGHAVFEEHGVALGFRRLAILDVSSAGNQPMASRSGRYTMIFNGEVYNYRELRNEIGQGAAFRGTSDTEVILEAFERWGVRRALERFVGMFAIAIWDAGDRKLILVRDRLGIKPLYVFREPGFVSFASETRALRVAPRFNSALDPISIAAYLRYLYVPAPRSIYAGVSKLPPGTMLEISDPAGDLPEPTPYWSLRDHWNEGISSRRENDGEAAADELESILQDAVRLRMRSDVPLGALLSGGVDSSLVVGMMQRAASTPVKTFSIGFDSAEHDETHHAAAVARHFGTEHHPLRVTGQDALELAPQVPAIMDEPLADPSIIPTYLVSGLARSEVTVALSGDGGDELFAGYNRYAHGERWIVGLDKIPGSLARPAGNALRRSGAAMGSVARHLLDGLRWEQPRLLDSKIEKLSRLLTEADAGTRYRSLLSAGGDPDGVLLGKGSDPSMLLSVFDTESQASVLDRMMLIDQMEYLPDDLLAKVDRASMAVSLEVRVPILDHRVVEFSWGLPREMKLGPNGDTKWLLRQVLYRMIPKRIVERPKVGFSVPMDDWLRGPLAGWANDSIASLHQSPEVFDAGALQEVQGRFQQRRETGLSVWALALLGAWIGASAESVPLAGAKIEGV